VTHLFGWAILHPFSDSFVKFSKDFPAQWAVTVVAVLLGVSYFINWDYPSISSLISFSVGKTIINPFGNGFCHLFGCLRLIIVLPTLLRLNRCGTFIKVNVAGSAWSVYSPLQISDLFI